MLFLFDNSGDLWFMNRWYSHLSFFFVALCVFFSFFAVMYHSFPRAIFVKDFRFCANKIFGGDCKTAVVEKKSKNPSSLKIKTAGFSSKKYVPSGLNTVFDFDTNKSFEQYITATKKMIKEARLDLDTPLAKEIVEGNAPFFYNPPASCPNQKKKRGILLIHGLNDSAYVMRTLGRHFQKNCFVVFSVLLTGNGTRVADSMDVSYESWRKLVKYAADKLRKRVDEFYLGGYSNGGILSIDYVNEYGNVHGLVLFAPSLSVDYFARIAFIAKYFKSVLTQHKNKDFFKYETTSMNSVAQLQSLLSKVKDSLSKDNSNMKNTKVFAVFSKEDTTVHTMDSMQYLLKNIDNEKSMIVLYHQSELDKSPTITKEFDWEKTNIKTVQNVILEKNILSAAHTSFLNAPNDKWYGINGKYRNCLHYHKDAEKKKKCLHDKDVFYGETTKKNLDKGILVRLSFNPFISQLFHSMDDFFTKQN